MAEHIPVLVVCTTAGEPSPKVKLQVNGLVPPVNVAVKVALPPSITGDGATVKLVTTSGMPENVIVTGCVKVTNLTFTLSRTVLPLVTLMPLRRLKWPGGGLVNISVLPPSFTRLVMSKGPKLTSWPWFGR